jgi:hypothetical protein
MKIKNFNLMKIKNFNLMKIKYFNLMKIKYFNLMKIKYFNLMKIKNFNFLKLKYYNLLKLKYFIFKKIKNNNFFINFFISLKIQKSRVVYSIMLLKIMEKMKKKKVDFFLKHHNKEATVYLEIRIHLYFREVYSVNYNLNKIFLHKILQFSNNNHNNSNNQGYFQVVYLEIVVNNNKVLHYFQVNQH